MTVCSRGRDQRRQALDKLKWGEYQLGAPIRTRLGQTVDQPLRINSYKSRPPSLPWYTNKELEKIGSVEAGGFSSPRIQFRPVIPRPIAAPD